jgi:transcriptional regulator with XRE-family HTH domain
VLAPREVAALRARYDLSRAQFARLTHLGEATIARWERGELIQNAAYDQFLHLLSFPENIQRLRDRNESPTAQYAVIRFRRLTLTAALLAKQDTFQLRPTGT